MGIIIYVIIAVLIARFLLRYSRTVSERRKCINNLGIPDEPNPFYDSSKDAFTCLMHSGGSTSICFRGGGGFTANARKKRDI